MLQSGLHEKTHKIFGKAYKWSHHNFAPFASSGHIRRTAEIEYSDGTFDFRVEYIDRWGKLERIRFLRATRPTSLRRPFRQSRGAGF